MKAAARGVEAVIVVGAANSSNSLRLREVAEREGCAAQLVADARAIDWRRARRRAFGRRHAPELLRRRSLVERIIEALGERFAIAIETLRTASESEAFPLPRALREAV